MERGPLELPDVTLDRAQRVRFIVVALFVAFAVLRVVPDGVRAFYPLNLFNYATDAAGVVVAIPHAAQHPRGDRIALGDVVRMDRIAPFDRKPGLVGPGYSRDTPDRRLPVERAGRVRVLKFAAVPENVASRASVVVRIVLFIAALALASILFLVRPSFATAALFFYCLGAPAPTTFSEVVLDNPWQQIPIWIADVLHGLGRPALLLFALCLLIDDPRVQRGAALGCGLGGFALGNLNAFAQWSLIYAARPVPALADAYVHVSSVITGVAVAAFAGALVRATPRGRIRIGWVVATFALAGLARVASDTLFPGRIAPWANALLLSAGILPIAAVWFSVVRYRFFNVDFVVGRAIVYVALTAAVVGAITLAEEVGTYVFYQNTDIAYGFLIVISTLIGAATGKIREVIEALVDRYVFRDRVDRRHALDLIAGYILDAETTEDVYRALLEDVTHALGLTFAGIFVRDAAGAFVRERDCRWPADFDLRLPASDDFVREIGRTRATLEFSGKKRHRDLVARLDPRLALAAPLFVDRNLGALVVYGRNVSGLNLNSDERVRLARLVAHASLALAGIELARSRDERSGVPLTTPQ